MATDEEYLDNLLKAAMEEDNQLQGGNMSDAVFSEEGAGDEDEDWKNSLDEMLASVNTADNEIDGDIALTDMDFSDFTDIMDESVEKYQEIGETGMDELDIMDLGDLGLDIMDESMEEAMASTGEDAALEDSDANPETVNDLMYIAQNMDNESMSLQDEYATHEASDQEEQEAEPKKSRKELQEEKKERKRLAREEKRMAKERKKDEKKAEKESKKEAKKAGAFSSFVEFLTAEEEDEGDKAKGSAEDLEGASENAGLEEIEVSDKKDKKDKKKKKDKKGKKGKKGKAQSEGGEGEEGNEGEAAPDPKKAAKQAKKALKEQKKKERAEQKANEPRVKVLSRKTFMVLVAFCATIVAAVVFLSVFLSDFVDKTRARQAFNDGDYHETYVLLYGKDLSAGDQVLYHRASILIHLERKLEVYEYNMRNGEVSQAVDVLLQGVAQYNELASGDTYGAGNELKEIYLRILDILSQQYGLSEEEAIELLTYDDITYSQKIYQITMGTDFGGVEGGSDEPQQPQDILPEEEDIINMEVTGEGA